MAGLFDKLGATMPAPAQVSPVGQLQVVRQMSGGAVVVRDEAGNQFIRLPDGRLEPDSVARPTSGPGISMDPSSAFTDTPWSPRWIDMPWGFEGSGGNTQLPTINASDILFRPQETRWLDTEGGGQETLPNRWEWASPDVASRYPVIGNLNTSSVAFLPGEDQNSFYAMLKSADKQGTRVRYVKQGNEYVPVPDTSVNVGWDTNSGFRDIAPALAVMAPAIAGVVAPGLFGGAAGGAAATGDFFGGLGAAEAGAFGTGAGNVAELFGLSGAAAPAAGLAGADAVGAAEFIGGTGAATAPSAGLFGGAAAPAAGAAQAGGWLTDLLRSPLTQAIAPRLLDLGAGWYADRQARGAQDQLFQATQQGAADYRQAGMDYADRMRSLIPSINEAFTYRPATVNTGFATSQIDPTTGQVSRTLAAPYAAAREGYLGASQGLFSQLRDFNPQTFAQQRFQAAQDLLAPQDRLAEQNLMQELYNKGGYGLALNQPGAAGGTAQVNPYLSTLLNSRAQRDKEMAFGALREGENYLDNLINRQRGLFSSAVGVDQLGDSVFPLASSWGDTFNRARQEQALRTTGLLGGSYAAERDATQRYIEAMLGAQQARIGSNALSGAERNRQIYESLRGMPWGDIFNRVSGWLGG